MLKIGLSSCGKEISNELFRAYSFAGIEAMEISLSKEKCDAFNFSDVRRLADKNGVKLWSFHLPFMPFSVIDISEPTLKHSTVEYLTALIKKGADAGIEKFIVHPSGEPIENSDRKIRLETAKESLYTLACTADECGCVICVEDLPRTCLGNNSTEINELISVHPSLRVCFDTNHLLSESIPDFIKSVGNKIVTTHISDYDYVDEKHWLPGEGSINWSEVVSSLEGIGYNGVWLYEVGFKAPKTIKRSRDLNCNDFAENARKYLK